jgi:hypothetical protein
MHTLEPTMPYMRLYLVPYDDDAEALLLVPNAAIVPVDVEAFDADMYLASVMRAAARLAFSASSTRGS